MKPNQRSRQDHSERNQPRPHFPRELRIVYEDDFVIGVNKPPGLPAVPIPGSDTPSALSLVSARLKLRRQEAFIVHRIDRFASGVLLFAKTKPDREFLVRQFLQHLPLRRYLAIVRGHFAAYQGTLVHYFKKSGMFQNLTSAEDPEGARAELRYFVRQNLRDASLVAVELSTGLQNQIRVQLAAVGHPVIGDRKYSPVEASEELIDRVALHAEHLEFTHPRSGMRIVIDCGPPPDFMALRGALSLRKFRKSQTPSPNPIDEGGY